MKYQIHPDHGYHIAYTNDEAEGNEKRGWRTVSEQEFWTRPKKTVDRFTLGVPMIDKNIPELAVRLENDVVPKRRGRPPKVQESVNDNGA